MHIVRDRQAHVSRPLSWSSLRIDRRAASGGQIVAMVQTAEPWRRNHSGTHTGLDHFFTTGWRSLCQGEIVRNIKSRLRMPLHQNGKLLPHGHIFQEWVAAGTGRSNEQDKQEPQR